VFGFAKDLGSVSKSSVNTLFTIGLTQDNAVQLLGDDPNGNLTTYQSLWKSYFGSDLDAVSKNPNSLLNTTLVIDKTTGYLLL
jgi:hypothetical protein